MFQHISSKFASKQSKLLLIVLVSVVLILTAWVYNSQNSNSLPIITRDNCSNKSKLINLDTTNPYMAKLDSYQSLCSSLAFDSMMIFTFMPQDAEAMDQEVKNLSGKLATFKQAGVKPIIVLEPTSEEGLLNFYDFELGKYDQSLRSLFGQLQAKGVTSDMMDNIIPFPEPNIPTWDRNNSSPSGYAKNFNKTITILREFYPEARGTILLNTKTYATDDRNWASGQVTSLKPYITKLDPNLVKSIGLQGFPWHSPNNQKAFDEKEASKFLPLKLIEELSTELSNKSIVLNTGTFYTKYTKNQEETIKVTPAKRKEILDSILIESKTLINKGYQVHINLFAEDKSKTAEDTDWSYKGPDHQAILKEFISRSDVMGISLSVFDK
jgi:hypothetical protein